MSAVPFNPNIPNESRAYQLWITLSILTFAMLLTTILRIGGKLKSKLPLRMDDHLILLAAILNVITTSFDMVSIHYGFGRHTQYLDENQIIGATKYLQLALGVAGLVLCAVKSSICFFLLSIIKGTHRKFTIAIWILLGFTVVTAFIGELLWGLQAQPFPRLWDPRIPGKVWSTQRLLDVVYIVNSFGAFTDIVYALSPIYFLWNLKIDKRRKVTLLVLIALGMLLAIVSFFTIAYGREFLHSDASWILVNDYICDMVERNVSTVVANLPVLWNLYVPTKLTSTRGYGSRPYGSRLVDGTTDGTTSKSQNPKIGSTSTTIEQSKRGSADPYDLDLEDSIPLKDRGANFGNENRGNTGISVVVVEGDKGTPDSTAEPDPAIPPEWSQPPAYNLSESRAPVTTTRFYARK